MILSFKMLSGLDIRIVGDGYVTEQSLSEGTLINPDEPDSDSITTSFRNIQSRRGSDTEESIVGG